MKLPAGYLFIPHLDRKRLQLYLEEKTLVTCEGCKHWTNCETSESDCSFYGVCDNLNRVTVYDWFCKDGEAKDNGEDN